MRRILAPLIAAVTISASSVVHGGDYASKGIIIATGAVILSALAIWLSGSLYGAAIGIICTLLFWFTYRTGAQAKAELDAMYHADDDEGVLVAYALPVTITCLLIGGASFFAGWLWAFTIVPCIISPLLPYLAVKKFNMHNGMTERKNRMVTELATPGAVNCTAVLLATSEGLRGWLG